MKRGKKDENLCIFNQRCWRLFFSFKFHESLEWTVRKRLELLGGVPVPQQRQKYNDRYYLHLPIFWYDIQFYFHSWKMLESFRSWKSWKLKMKSMFLFCKFDFAENFLAGGQGARTSRVNVCWDFSKYYQISTKVIRQFYDFYKIILAFFKTKLLK